MGWNDHVEFVETECQDCGEISTWEEWDDTALARYGGENRDLGTFLGHDDQKAGRCPYCGSTDGILVQDEYDPQTYVDRNDPDV